MSTVRRASAALSVPLVAASLVTPAGTAHAAASQAAGPRAAGSGAQNAPPTDPVGGPQLGGRGMVVNQEPGVPAPPKIKAASYLISDGDTGQVLAAKDPHGRYLSASTLKTLTALTLVPKLDAGRLVRPSQKACDVEGTKVGLTPKMQYKVSDLFHALMMMSANDAAVALAEADGGMKKTLADMNAEAGRLNAHDTLAGSPDGLDKDRGLNIRTQHTSSYDLALILREGMKNPEYRKYVQAIDFFFPAPPTKKQRKKGKKTGGYPIHTHNRMLAGQAQEYDGMLGGKNGYTVTAGQTYVAAAKRGEHTIIISLMRADKPPSAYAAKLLDWGFAARGKVKPVGTLVPPGDNANGTDTGKAGNDRSNSLLPTNPLTPDDSIRGWALLGGGAVGAVLGVGALFLVLRRRRRGGYVAPAGAAAGRAPRPPADASPDNPYDQ
ncbi:D-alanyl-D-alanine carboxypeptidase family protein [Actinomadura xylanilytica]|uniref:D-alanyl-D-alanine carboxypeptidase family protein n=1 Tax=Actinomadura xylanilytica TaxID=887459 RepID=UPI00255A88FB|nr:D-alanyl-D-alanine carboxypeptidase [Actinomadura xylanilytica]MDL4776156.1 D-alanyl-D-alanine carboxypeptidase [Actinomadura xylanilytica]